MYPFTGIKDVSAFLLAKHYHQTISAFAISLSPSETHTVAVAFNKKSETFSLEPICKSLRLQTHIMAYWLNKTYWGYHKSSKKM